MLFGNLQKLSISLFQLKEIDQQKLISRSIGNIVIMERLMFILKEFDLFSNQIGFHMNKSFQYKTKLGGFASILAVSFIIAFFWSSTILFELLINNSFDLVLYFKKLVLSINKAKVYYPNPPKSTLNTDEFMFALRIYQEKRDFLTRPYFNITVQLGIFETIGKEQTRKYFNIELEPCTKNHWDQLKGYANFTKLFESYGDDYLCPVLGQNMALQGVFGSDVFSFLSIQVTSCKTPNDQTKKWNPVCAPQEEVDEITSNLGFHGVNMYHSNYVLNVDQPQEFYTPYINDKLYFTFVPYQMTKVCDIYFSDFNVINDESVFPYSKNHQYKFLTQENNDVRETTQLFRSGNVFVDLTVRLSPYVTVYERSFKKVSQLMSELGGFIQIVITCIGLLMRRYNKFNFIMELAHNLYSFSKNDEIKNSHQLSSHNQIISQRSPEAKYIHQESNINNFPSLIQQKLKNQPSLNTFKNSDQFIGKQNKGNKLDYPSFSDFPDHHHLGQSQDNKTPPPLLKLGNCISRDQSQDQLYQVQNEKGSMNYDLEEKHSKYQFMLSQFRRIITKQNQLYTNLRYYLSIFTCRKLFNSEYHIYLNQATKMIHDDLDICNILDKIQQIEKLKNIVFSKHQKILFNYYPKPKIQLKNLKKKSKSPDICQNFNSGIDQSIQQGKKQKTTCEKNIDNQNGLLSQKCDFSTVESYTVKQILKK